MAFTYGFYNYNDNDPSEDAKLYDAEQMSHMFDGLITDGVYEHIGNKFRVSESSAANTVYVDTGRAWFNHTWNYNDEVLSLEAPSQPSSSRIDALVIDINSDTRHNEFRWVQGTEASSPEKPTLINTPTHVQKAIAYITRSSSQYITDDMIENVVGTDETPFVTGVLKNEVVYSKVLIAGYTSVQFNGVETTENSIVNIGTSIPGVEYDEITRTGRQYVISFAEPFEENITVYMIVSEVR